MTRSHGVALRFVAHHCACLRYPHPLKPCDIRTLGKVAGSRRRTPTSEDPEASMSARDDAGIAAALAAYCESNDFVADADALFAAIDAYAAGKPIATLPARAPTFDAFDVDAYPDDDT